MAEYWGWIGFGVIVLAMLGVDTLVLYRRPRTMPLRESVLWCLAWVALAAGFAMAVYARSGPEKALEFVSGYVVEWSLSLDNLFVFLVIFNAFAVPETSRQRVLFWGILGAILLRGIFIAAGAALLAHFEWILYVFGAFLVITGIKLLCHPNDNVDPTRSPALRLFRRFVEATPDYHAQRFFVRRDGRRLATPLVPVLLVIGTTDLIFAVDSIPAIFGITKDPFIVYSSNVFAVLGLRGLFFLLAGIMGLFRYLKVGISCVLAFVGVKMLIVDLYTIPSATSLLIIGGILSASILASVLAPVPKGDDGQAQSEPPPENALRTMPSGATERA